MKATFLLALGCALTSNVVSARADVQLSELWSDGIVLQRDAPIPIWGRAAAGEKVSVELAGAKADTIAAVDGQWRLDLPAQKASSGKKMTISGRNTVTISDVAIGEVWLASGQSNMELRVPRTLNADQEIANGNYPLIRQFHIARNIAETPQTELKGHWEAASPQTVGNFTAVGYYFARDIFQKLGVPVGIIHASYGGTPAQAWTPPATLKNDATVQIVNENWTRRLEDYPEATQKYEAQKARWQARADEAKAAGTRVPDAPFAPAGPGTKAMPSGLYNGMIAPVAPFGIRGVLWYQGESDARAPEIYQSLFPALIRGWRAEWKRELPFLFVQLANFHKPQTEPVEDGWANLREAQANALALPKTGMAVAIDVGEAGDIHPKNKQEVGRRLALVALHDVYGQEIESSGPQYLSTKTEGGALRLQFAHAAGLRANDGEPKGFAIAGADGKFAWANAKIEGDSVVLSSPQVLAPVAARYNWADNPLGNLVNAVGLPAAPFRTDSPIKMKTETEKVVTDRADAPEPKPTRTVIYKSTTNAAGAKVELAMNIFEPAGHKASDKTPAIVFFFGGGWNAGSPELFFGHCAYFASRGMVAFAPDYRVKNRQQTTPFESTIDAKSAMRWVRAHATELGIDAGRIAAAGSSAGGHVAASTAMIPGFDEPTENATISPAPNALILYNPVIDTSPAGYGNERLGDRWQEISPLQHVRAGLPPTIVFHGTADKTVPYQNAVDFEIAMKATGNRCELVTFPGVGHGFAYNLSHKAANQAAFDSDKFLASLGYIQGAPTLAAPTQ